MVDFNHYSGRVDDVLRGSHFQSGRRKWQSLRNGKLFLFAAHRAHFCSSLLHLAHVEGVEQGRPGRGLHQTTLNRQPTILNCREWEELTTWSTANPQPNLTSTSHIHFSHLICSNVFIYLLHLNFSVSTLFIQFKFYLFKHTRINTTNSNQMSFIESSQSRSVSWLLSALLIYL